jgi:hypothetical protein
MSQKTVERQEGLYQLSGGPELGHLKSLKGVRNIASEYGRFYAGLIRAYTDDIPEAEREGQVGRMVDSLPTHMAPLYRKGLGRLKGEVESNLGLITPHQGGEAEFLLEYLAGEKNKTAREVAGILAESGKASYTERGGIPFLEVEPDYYTQMQQMGVFNPGARGFAWLSPRGKPSFMVVRKPGTTVISEGGSDPWTAVPVTVESGELSVRKTTEHELHHIVWHLMDRAGFIRKTDIEDAEGAKAFGFFRGEYSAHLFNAGGDIEPAHVVFRNADPRKFAYTKNKATLETAETTLKQASLCMEVAALKGVKTEDFMYVAFRSRNFQEMRENSYLLSGITGQNDGELQQVLSKHAGNTWMAAAVRDIADRARKSA